MMSHLRRVWTTMPSTVSRVYSWHLFHPTIPTSQLRWGNITRPCGHPTYPIDAFTYSHVRVFQIPNYRWLNNYNRSIPITRAKSRSSVPIHEEPGAFMNLRSSCIRVDNWWFAHVMNYDRDPFVVIVDTSVVPLDVEYRLLSSKYVSTTIRDRKCKRLDQCLKLVDMWHRLYGSDWSWERNVRPELG